MTTRQYTKYSGVNVPVIQGAGGGKGSGKVAPNSLYSTDILLVTTGIGEGPIYRVNPNGPQDIQIQDSTIDDLLNLDSDGSVNTEKFVTYSTPGTLSQDPIPYFGEETVVPQVFASKVVLKKGNIAGIPSSSITLQETSANDWDELRFSFIIESLAKADNKGNVRAYTLRIRITVYDRISGGEPNTVIRTVEKEINGKTDIPVKRVVSVLIPRNRRSVDGYRFSIEKISNESNDSKIRDDISVIGWEEIKKAPQAYPRTAVIGYGLKAVDEHTGGVPNFTSWIKGLIVKVPSNYNQPILEDGQIDWRQIEVPPNGLNSYTSRGYTLQKSGTSTVLTEANPQIYVGTWDGKFVYSWTENPVWIVYDILTNTTYGLGIPEENIDKYKFYQVAQYCDACDAVTGRFIGVDGVADGSFRYKSRGVNVRVRENQIGIVKGRNIKERRFTLGLTIADQEPAMDILNRITSTFRSVLVYSGGKITLATDMPDEYPVMLFNETNIKEGSLQISGAKESGIYTGVDVTYIEPTNHFKRETVRIDSAEANDGSEVSNIENILALDLAGVTRRSQALRMGQYQIASSKYLRRNISFTTGTDALTLTPGDVISVSAQGAGIAYGYGGKIIANSSLVSNNTNVYIEHFTVPGITSGLITNNNYPLVMRVIQTATDKVETYILSNSIFSLSSSRDDVSGFDTGTFKVIGRFDPISKSLKNLSQFTANIAPKTGDLWSIGEIRDPNSFYTNRAGKLFKVTGLKRESDKEEVTVSGIEYIPDIYVDSDTFIAYEPESYIDFTSPFSPPPSPVFSFAAIPRTTSDGSVVVDGKIATYTEQTNYSQRFETEYYISNPSDSVLLLSSTGSSPTVFTGVSNSGISNNSPSATLSGKNGFSSPVGEIKLLCNSVSLVGTSTVELTLEGLNVCHDENFDLHVLEVNDGNIFQNLKGIDRVRIPLIEKSDTGGLLNFVGYNPQEVSYSAEIIDYNLITNKVSIINSLGGDTTLINALPTPPFYVTISQVLASNNYLNNSFYLTGSELLNVKTGIINKNLTNTIQLDVKPRHANFVRFYVDGILVNSGSYTLNTNKSLSLNANIIYSATEADSTYRVEVDYYAPPAIEVGDKLEVSFANVFTVANSSYDILSNGYNNSLTSNNIYRIDLVETPEIDLSGFFFTNISPNPVGTIANVIGNTFTLDYSTSSYPGLFNLTNNRIYYLETGSVFEKIFLTDDLTIQNLPVGTTTIKARNRNALGRLSPFIQKSVTVANIPIQKVQNLQLEESIYREQTGGVAVRITCSFDHIVGQEVTDYEISYRISSGEELGSDDGGAPLTDFNTVKVPAVGITEDGKIRFTINNVNRGRTSESNSIDVRVTPLNRDIRGITATATKSIVGKTTPPNNIFNLTGGQQNDVITLFWSYVRNNTELADLDLKEVIIKRVPGVVQDTSESLLTAFLSAPDFVTVSAGSVRKSVSIDTYGTYTYLARTRDTSGNFSESVVATTITTSKPKRSTTIAAYNEDSPSVDFSDIPNTNSSEFNWPSFSNSNSGGIAYSYTSSVDNANGSSSGWSSGPLSNTDILADSNAIYTTQIRDYGQPVIGVINFEAEFSQEVQTTYNDIKETVIEGVTEVSGDSTILVDVDFGGIGHILGFNNANVTTGRYDSNNSTWMTGPASGNVWAIWNPGQFNNDTANANSFALIAGLVNANAIKLGATFYANGDPTNSNSFSNVTTKASQYNLVNLLQYSDIGTTTTFLGDVGAISTQTLIRTSTESPYYANGNVNVSVFGSGDGFIPYEVGTKPLRYFQLKFIINNSKPDEYDFTLDKLRYSLDKDQTTFTTTVPYSSNPTNVDISAASFLFRPVITYTVLDQIDAEANPAIVVTSAATNNSISFKLFASNGTGMYTANSTANIMITATGV